MKVVVIDGQSGHLGQLIVEEIVKRKLNCSLYGIGTNCIATSLMMKSGASFGATGENPIIVNVKDADVIIGPIGIICADALLGEITSSIAISVGQAKAIKLLLPYNHCNNQVVGVEKLSMNELVKRSIDELSKIIK